MSKELVIGSNRHETKVAILEEDQLVEVYFQRGQEYSLAGSIHKGRVTRVLPGMQSAFVDLGLERDTFLYVSDFFEEHEDIDTVTDELPVKAERRDQRRGPDRNSGERGQTDRNQADRSQGDRSQGERDRNANDRHQLESAPERSSDEPFGDIAKVRSMGGASPVQPEREEEGDFLSGSPELPVIAGEAERAEGDSNRGDRGGDRGNRRGRRRRPRGRGLPDTKYAQPSALSSPGPSGFSAEPSDGRASPESAPAERTHSERTQSERLPGEKIGGERPSGERPSFERAYADRGSLDRIPTAERLRSERSGHERPARSEEPTRYEPSEPSDGIMLPGESLAKYRRAPVASAQSVPQPTRQVDDTPVAAESFHTESSPVHPVYSEPQIVEPLSLSFEEDEIPVEDLAAEQEAIRDEAEELELTDRIFSHHEVEDLPEDEKLADIEFERVEPTPSSDQTDQVHESVYELNGERPPVQAIDLDSPVVDKHEEFALPFESTGTVEVIGPIVIDAEPLATFEASAPLGLAVEGEEDEFEEGEPGVGEPEELTGETRVGESSQTANLRDPNGRSLHRNSRRGRRRRGGNRFGSPGEANVGGPVPAVGLAAGTATALEPVEIRRELPEVRTERAERVMPSISDLLKAGQEIIVQIAKEPLGQKGARITSHIALPGRYVVFMPSVTHLGVSRKVESDEERQRLKQILQKHRSGTTGGFIVRTAGEGVPEDEIAADMNFLYNLWLDIRQKAEKKPAPALLHYDLDIVQRILRDHVTEEYKAIWVDNEDMYENVLTFMQRFQPTLVSRVKMYTREAPIFDAFNITQELEKALRPKVWLKSGGYIVINQTEALVAIDINTGKYVGKSNRLEDTIVKTNTEAVKEIVRQIRLRDLGGIIVVDFIDMDERKNRQKVMAALEEAMETDKAPYKILQFNDFGLVAITRKRVKQSLERTLCSPCPYCEGAGYVKSVQTTIGEILVEAQKIARAVDGKDVVLRVNPEVAKVLKASNNKFLEEIEEILKRPVLVAGDPTLHTEKFDLA